MFAISIYFSYRTITHIYVCLTFISTRTDHCFSWYALIAFLMLRCFFINASAALGDMPNSCVSIVTALFHNLLFDRRISIILFPFTLPSWIISEVEIIFNTIFWAVPAFILVLPVTNSAPVNNSTGQSATSAILLPGLHTIQPVGTFFSLAFMRPPNTY